MSTQPQSFNVLIASYLEPDLVERIRTDVPAVNVIYRPDLLGQPRFAADHTSEPQRTDAQEAEWRSLLGRAHILFDFDRTAGPDLPDLAPNLRWIQGTSAGIGQLVKRNGYIERTDWIFTTASGVHARPLAEFVVMVMLMFAKNYPLLKQQQDARVWARYSGTEIGGRTLAIVGLGKIGRETARLTSLLGVRVIGNRRSSGSAVPHVEQLYPPDQLHEMLSQAHYLVLACPHTPETEGLIGAAELAALPAGAVLINIARGAVVDTAALLDALTSEHLGGAALDVTDPEPLPSDHPLWGLPNVLISPHSASTVDRENGRIVDIFCENLHRFLRGEPLINQLDTQTLY